MDGENNWYNINPSGISSSVEYLLSKQRGRVQFPYPAQNEEENSPYLCFCFHN